MSMITLIIMLIVRRTGIQYHSATPDTRIRNFSFEIIVLYMT